MFVVAWDTARIGSIDRQRDPADRRCRYPFINWHGPGDSGRDACGEQIGDGAGFAAEESAE